MYSFKKTEYANPGAENYAFVPNQTLPTFDLGGMGNVVFKQLNVMQPQQPIILHAITTDGYGGLVAGQLVGQPLSE